MPKFARTYSKVWCIKSEPEKEDNFDVNDFVSAFENQIVQTFSLPPSIMKYIIKELTAGPKLISTWKKIIKTCKYFFSKSPYYPVNTMRSFCNSWIADNECLIMSNVKGNIWLVGELAIDSSSRKKSLLCELYPKISKSNIMTLSIQRQTLNLDVIAGLSCRCLEITNSEICDENGKPVQFDKVLERITFAQVLIINCRGMYSMLQGEETPENIATALLKFEKLVMVQFKNVPMDFAVWPFAEIQDKLGKAKLSSQLDYGKYMRKIDQS